MVYISLCIYSPYLKIQLITRILLTLSYAIINNHSVSFGERVFQLLNQVCKILLILISSLKIEQIFRSEVFLRLT